MGKKKTKLFEVQDSYNDVIQAFNMDTYLHPTASCKRSQKFKKVSVFKSKNHQLDNYTIVKQVSFKNKNNVIHW